MCRVVKKVIQEKKIARVNVQNCEKRNVKKKFARTNMQNCEKIKKDDIVELYYYNIFRFIDVIVSSNLKMSSSSQKSSIDTIQISTLLPYNHFSQ